jgi:hypothetical protein
MFNKTHTDLQFLLSCPWLGMEVHRMSSAANPTVNKPKYTTPPFKFLKGIVCGFRKSMVHVNFLLQYAKGSLLQRIFLCISEQHVFVNITGNG